MDELINLIIGTAESPVEIAVHFFLFILLLDAIFSVINALIYGSRV